MTYIFQSVFPLIKKKYQKTLSWAPQGRRTLKLVFGTPDIRNL